MGARVRPFLLLLMLLFLISLFILIYCFLMFQPVISTVLMATKTIYLQFGLTILKFDPSLSLNQ